MIERVTKENLDQYEAFIKKHPKGLEVGSRDVEGRGRQH